MFWVSLQSVAGLELAIRLAIFDYAVVQQAGIEWEHTALMFDVGREFWESVVRHGFHTGEGRARRLLRACLETVMGLALGSTHELREGAAAAAPQVRRGPERGWRRDIDDDFHLHYWQQAGRRPEFAIVVPHNEFVIPR
jgi:hypothetical protein